MENAAEKINPYNELYYVGSILSEAIDDVKTIYSYEPYSKMGILFQLNERWKDIARKIADAESHRSYGR
jgi:hypothetical protein